MLNQINISTLDFDKGEVFLIDKPYEWTSFDVVKKIRGKLKVKKVGHAGTLDPLATGLLIVCAGKATKKINEYQDMGKSYSGTLVLGKTTPSVDLETAFDSETDYSHVTSDMVKKAADQLTGDIMQIPPIYSAIKVDGERAYKMARRKEDAKLDPRPVSVTKFEVDTSALPEVRFEIDCSKGTYIRSLVRDLGEALSCGAYMSSLCRTAIGHHKLDDAYNLEEFISSLHRD
ncbi:tRNA pseudouridine(55) synthase TruB [Reichenbachiella agarivorans]|uniref:tRNA pseudouridine synthase B n=1 Tax=Reichenbachiella agarivorans TaxID=2979464 RepID=A0ABY6CW56_9BACT|nr:tRNA pseudouridine(55) synthase TruB [Reichenbachiella agarivorans]UXP34169.1 tRNA pseudouridine(55) synthase TruB [Reichenbachiella agarivorans]